MKKTLSVSSLAHLPTLQKKDDETNRGAMCLRGWFFMRIFRYRRRADFPYLKQFRMFCVHSARNEGAMGQIPISPPGSVGLHSGALM